MSELICRICLDSDIRLYQITGSPVQDVYEKLSNKKVDENGQYCACYICYHHLKNCLDLAIKSRKSEELLAQVMTKTSKFNLKSISAVDRHTYGLVNSLAVTKVYSIQIPEYGNIIKTENQSDTVKNEVTNNSPAVDEAIEHQSTIKMEELSDSDAEEANDGLDEEEIEIDAAVQKEENSEIDSDDGPAEASVHPKKDRQLNKEQIITQDRPTSIQKDKISGHKSVIKPKVASTRDGKRKESEKLKKHRIHTEEKSFKCQFCDYTSSKSNSLRIHVKTHTGEKPFKCQFCNYSSSKSNNLKTHIRTHTGEKPFKCHLCNFTCSQNGGLKAHLKTHTEEKPFKCPYCNYTCKQNSCLKTHIRTHTGEKPFKCQCCSYTCSVSSQLKMHLRTHTGEKPFKCQYCSYTCAANNTLKKHIRTHTGEKPFLCQYCCYACSNNSNMKLHIRTHTGEKPFKCQYCSHACSSKRDLMDHIRTHTGEKPFKCHHCSRAYSDRSNYKKHIKTHREKSHSRTDAAVIL